MLQLANPYIFLLWWPYILRKQQFWRIFTPFFLSAGGIPFIFNVFFIGRNSLDLETNHFMRRTADYVWALLVIGSLIHITNVPLGSTVLFHPFTSAMTYLWSRANPTGQVSLFGMISCPATLLPYAYLGFDLLQGGLPLLIESCTGILSAHIYWYFAETLPATNERNPRRYLATPAFLTRLFPDSTDPSNVATNQATGGQTSGGGGRVQRTGWGGTAFAPRGSTIGGGGSGSQTPSGPAAALGASTAVGSRSWSSYLPFGGSGNQGGSPAASSSSSSSKEAQRRAMLEATEKRLRNSYQNSIAGSHARAMKNGGSVSATVGSAGSSSGTTSSSGVNLPQVNQAIRSRKPAGGSSSFSTMGKKGGDEEDDEELLNPSGSGGSVAEDRSHLASGSRPKTADSPDKAADSGSHTWGSGGQRLGE